MRKTGRREVNGKDKYFLDFNGEIILKTSIFHNSNLTIFEALVKFLKEEKSFNFHEISVILNRDERNIWTVYNNSLKKRPNEKKLG